MSVLFLLNLPGLVRILPNANRKIYELANPKGKFIIRLQAVSCTSRAQSYLASNTADQILCLASLLLLTGHLTWFFSLYFIYEILSFIGCTWQKRQNKCKRKVNMISIMIMFHSQQSRVRFVYLNLYLWEKKLPLTFSHMANPAPITQGSCHPMTTGSQWCKQFTKVESQIDL